MLKSLRPCTLPLLLLAAAPLAAQTTQGLISGRLVNVRTGKPIAGASILYASFATNASGTTRTGSTGDYYLPLLSPGLYRIRASAQGYQDQELYNLEVPVAGRLEVNFRLRPLNDVWEAGEYRSVFLPGSKTIVTFYGPDVDESRSGSFEADSGRRGALVSTLSQVIDPTQIRDLPLAGRDAYTMLVTQPGVTADTATSRGLGLSSTGQRPSASNFLLDGLENNNYLVTGPLTAIAPEAIQEYRVSTGVYSAEYGRTAGYVANAVTRSGGNQFHGIGYFYLKNDALNANDFQKNRAGQARTPVKENQFGFQVGGPIVRNRLFFSSAFERLRSRSRQDATAFLFPSSTFTQLFTAPGSPARRLLEQFPAPAVTPDPRRPWVGTTEIAPPVSVDRTLLLERVDWQRGPDQIMGRASFVRVGRPDFIWSPYPDFTSGLKQNTVSTAITWQRAIRPGLMNEAKFGIGLDRLDWDRPRPEIPTLASDDGVTLPGSSAFYAYRNHNRGIELLDNLIWIKGRHLFTFGGGALLTGSSGYLTAGRDGYYRFSNAVLFGASIPSLFSVSVVRGGRNIPQFDREFRSAQPFFFAQDAFKMTPRLAINYGFRYEAFGAPRSTGANKEQVVALGQGDSIASRLAGARLVPNTESLYSVRRNNWALRVGASYDLSGNGRTLVRAAYGIFYDRPFDNLWQNVRNNNFTLPLLAPRGVVNFLQPVNEVLASYPTVPPTDFPGLTMFDPGLKIGYAQNFFYGVQQQIAENWSLEVNGVGSLGRRLITTDVINREFTTTTFPGRYNAALPDIAYRAGQGFSNYHALTAVARYRARRAQFQASYTWSHAIDNQSEPLAGDFFDLSFTRVTGGGGRSARSSFSRQFDSSADRGSSDFDQRHNLIFFSVWELPWRVKLSQLAAFRTGFPYSVFASGTGFPTAGRGIVLNNRPDLVNPSGAELADRTSVPGGYRLLNRAAFRSVSDPGTLGNLGRNAFRGPGLYNIDFSLSRSFPLPWLGESWRVTLRGDAYNILNHANLNTPNGFLDDADFGVASYGRTGRSSGFPAVSPLNETARQVQLMLRLEW